MLWDPAHPLLVVGVEMSFGGFIITRAPLFLRSYMTEMTHTDTQKKKNSNCIFPSPILASSSYYSRNMRLRLVRRVVCGRFESQFRPAETDLSPQAGG